jgi:hypothetical protein
LFRNQFHRLLELLAVIQAGVELDPLAASQEQGPGFQTLTRRFAAAEMIGLNLEENTLLAVSVPDQTIAKDTDARIELQQGEEQESITGQNEYGRQD